MSKINLDEKIENEYQEFASRVKQKDKNLWLPIFLISILVISVGLMLFKQSSSSEKKQEPKKEQVEKKPQVKEEATAPQMFMLDANQKYGFINVDYANLRMEPSTSAQKVGNVVFGDVVYIAEEAVDEVGDSWYLIDVSLTQKATGQKAEASKEQAWLSNKVLTVLEGKELMEQAKQVEDGFDSLGLPVTYEDILGVANESSEILEVLFENEIEEKETIEEATVLHLENMDITLLENMAKEITLNGVSIPKTTIQSTFGESIILDEAMKIYVYPTKDGFVRAFYNGNNVNRITIQAFNK